MPDIWVDVDTAIVAPMSLMPIMQDDGLTIEPALVYNFAGIAVQWNFITTAGVYTAVSIIPTTADDHDISEVVANLGLYGIKIPASGGDANNDTEGFGWITGMATGLLPWRGPTIGCRAAAINNALIDGATVDVNVTAMAANVVTGASLNADACTKIIDDFETQSQADPTGFHVNVKEVNGTAQTANDNGADINEILIDTNELQADDYPTSIAAIKDETALIMADTNELQVDDTPAALAAIDAKIDVIDGIVDNILTDTGITLQGELDGIQADTEDIQARLPAALVTGRMSSDAVAISGSTDAADKLEASAETIILGAAAAGTLSTTQMTTDLTVSVIDQFNGRIIIFKEDTATVALRRQATNITACAVAGGLLTFTALTTAPQDGDTFNIV